VFSPAARCAAVSPMQMIGTNPAARAGVGLGGDRRIVSL